MIFWKQLESAPPCMQKFFHNGIAVLVLFFSWVCYTAEKGKHSCEKALLKSEVRF